MYSNKISKIFTGNTTVSAYPQSTTRPDGIPRVMTETAWLDRNSKDGTWHRTQIHDNADLDTMLVTHANNGFMYSK